MQLHQENGMEAYRLIPTKNSKARTIAAGAPREKGSRLKTDMQISPERCEDFASGGVSISV